MDKQQDGGPAFPHLVYNAELSGGEAVRSGALFGVPDPCKTCSDRDKADDEEPCASCGPPAWEYHDCRCEDDDTPNAEVSSK